jgi:hypothetical protein
MSNVRHLMRILQRLFSGRSTSKSETENLDPLGLSPRCVLCSRLAAEIEVSEASGVWKLKYSGPGGSNGSGDHISAERAEAIHTAFTPPYELLKIKAAEFHDDAGFCSACAKFYCPEHWSMSSSGGGKCPAGHFKGLDPHWSPEYDGA